jgi:hypothetical protein
MYHQTWLQKPPIGTPLDPDCGLYNGLVFYTPLWEGAGKTIQELITGLTLNFNGASTWAPGGRYVGLKCAANTDGAQATLPARYVNGGSPSLLGYPMSIVVGFRGLGTGSNNAPLCGIAVDNAGGAFYGAIRNSAGGDTLVGLGAQNFVIFGSTFSLADHVAGLTITGTTCTAYQDGLQSATASVSNTGPTWTSNAIFFVGDPATYNNRYSNTLVYWVAVYNRVLTAAEHLQWATNPWQIFMRWPDVPVFSQGTAPITATLTGPSSCYAGTASGNFTVALNKAYTGTITPSDGGAGGTFSPASLSWSNASNPQTFTYTASTAGTKSISISANPTIVITGSPISITASNLPVTAILGRDLQTVYFLVNDATAHRVPTAVTAVSSNPTVYVNGSSATISGPTWTNATKNTCFVAYYLSAAVQATDVLTYTAGSGWLTAGSLTIPATVTAPVINSRGKLEPQVGAWSASIPVAPWNPTAKTMPVGINTNNDPAQAASNYWIQQNGLHNCKNPWTDLSNNVCASTADGWPTSTTTLGYGAAVPLNTIGSNTVDSQLAVTPLGTYTFVADESNPASPMTVSLISLLSSPNNGVITGGLVNSGTLTGGVLVGRTWQWNVQLKSNHTHWNLGLAIEFTGPGSGVQTNTLVQAGAVLTRPLKGGAPQTPNRTNLACPDQQFVASLTSTNGHTPFSFRGGDCTWSSDGNSAVGNWANAQNLNWFSWAPNTQSGATTNIGGAPRTMTVTEVRPYSLATSPNIYFPDSYGGLATSSSGNAAGAYQYAPSSINFWTNAVGGATASYAMFEAVCNVNHGFTTGQCLGQSTGINWTGASSTIQFTNTNGAQNAGGDFVALANYNNVVWVTGPKTFMTTFYWGVSGGIGNCTSDNTGLNIGMTEQAPDANSVPAAVMAAAAGALRIQRLVLEIPMGWSTADASSLVLSALQYYPGCPEIVLELGNEAWSAQTQGQYYLGALANLFGIGTGSFYWGYVWRSDQIRTAVKTAVTAAGYTTKISLALVTQAASPSVTTGYATAANSLGISADYVLTSGYDNIPTDSTIQTAGTTWAVGSMVDLHRWYLAYSTTLNGPSGIIQGHITAAATIPGKPLVACYEGSLQSQIAHGTTSQGALSHDAWYHPNTYDAFNTHMSVYQTNGNNWFTLTYYCNNPNGASPNVNRWMLYSWAGQAAGRGNGTGGGVVNQFATAQGGSPGDGHSHDGPDGINTYGNDSVLAQAFLDWASAANPAPAMRLTSVTRRWFPGLRSGGRLRLGSRS